ncbi:DUF6456 domain-containing protein [Rhodoligotrophos ferricapiens]|uniref:DUF6456 domain-containing protein n=1 Tax=Rhodoligotrophos ferricapiens TaxID=3069264 RepID=UPI00315CA9F8
MAASEHKVIRSAERIFPKLATGSRIFRKKSIEGREGWRLVPPETERHSIELDGEIVSAWLAKDWLCLDGDVAELSQAGRAWLRRHNAGKADPYEAQHQLLRRQRIRQDDGNWQEVTVNAAENPLTWLARRKDANGQPMITAEQVAAGERLRRDFTLAGMSPSITSRWDASVVGNGGHHSRAAGAGELQDAVIAAKARLNAALDAIGPELTRVLLEVCCLANGLEAAERSFGWPPRSAKIVLQIALTQLARHYGLIGRAERRQGATVRSWGAEGYRPSL